MVHVSTRSNLCGN